MCFRASFPVKKLLGSSSFRGQKSKMADKVKFQDLAPSMPSVDSTASCWVGGETGIVKGDLYLIFFATTSKDS